MYKSCLTTLHSFKWKTMQPTDHLKYNEQCWWKFNFHVFDTQKIFYRNRARNLCNSCNYAILSGRASWRGTDSVCRWQHMYAHSTATDTRQSGSSLRRAARWRRRRGLHEEDQRWLRRVQTLRAGLCYHARVDGKNWRTVCAATLPKNGECKHR